MYFRDKNGKLYEKHIKSVNENGKLIEGKMYDPIELIEKWDYIYDDKGNCTSVNYFDNNGKLRRREVNRYDKDNRLVEFIYYDRNGDVGFRSINQYNEKGQIKDTITFENYNSSTTIESYEYNDNNIIKISYYKSKAYDSSKQEYIKGELKRQRSFSYVFDSYGNWITKKEELNGVLNEIWERKIAYY
jgi:hypothetical protein